jgi:hypothetical protein
MPRLFRSCGIVRGSGGGGHCPRITHRKARYILGHRSCLYRRLSANIRRSVPIDTISSRRGTRRAFGRKREILRGNRGRDGRTDGRGEGAEATDRIREKQQRTGQADWPARSDRSRRAANNRFRADEIAGSRQLRVIVSSYLAAREEREGARGSIFDIRSDIDSIYLAAGAPRETRSLGRTHVARHKLSTKVLRDVTQ